LRLQGRLDEADAALATALDIQRVALGDDHPDLSNAWFQRGLVAQSRKEFEEAERALRTASSLRDRHLGSASHAAALCRVRLAGVLAECERSGEARRLLDEARDALAQALPADHPDRAEAERIAARLT
jgi:tetratricopeptide (TPR) repeat protein